MPVRLLLVDDHVAVREGLRRSLETCGLEVVGEAGDAAGALDRVVALSPDVVLMDVSLRSGDGIALTREVLRAAPRTRVIVLTMLGDELTRQAADEAGAAGFLTNDCRTSDIVSLVASITAPPPSRADGPCVRRTKPLLSAREREVLQLVADGASTKIVARQLYISQKTAKNHLANIYQKLGVADRTQAVLKGLRSGSIQLRT